METETHIGLQCHVSQLPIVVLFLIHADTGRKEPKKPLLVPTACDMFGYYYYEVR